jgi:hypothetical protein
MQVLPSSPVLPHEKSQRIPWMLLRGLRFTQTRVATRRATLLTSRIMGMYHSSVSAREWYHGGWGWVGWDGSWQGCFVALCAWWSRRWSGGGFGVLVAACEKVKEKRVGSGAVNMQLSLDTH